MTADRVTIKGTSDGLIITLGAGVWPALVEELDHRLGQKASFFKGGRVALRVGSRQLTAAEIETAGQVLDRHGVSLWAIESDSPITRELVAGLGLEVELVRTIPVPAPAAPAGDSMVVRRTLRSGQVIHHPGHIVVIGDINPGAEIRAGGSVVIWGRLRGTVHAGIGEGQAENAVVCALQFSPAQLRIGDQVALAPADHPGFEAVPEMAFIQDGRIVAEPWQQAGEAINQNIKK